MKGSIDERAEGASGASVGRQPGGVSIDERAEGASGASVGRQPGGVSIETLLRRLGAQEGVPLAPRTTWRVGGPARFLVTAPPTDALAELFALCLETGTRVDVLGRGSNVLIADAGIDGVVVTFPDNRAPLAVDAAAGTVIAGAGVSMARLSARANAVGLSGFEWCAGIPGSVGGSAVMNAGLVTGGTREMADVVTHVTHVSATGAVTRLDAAALAYTTRRSTLQGAGGCVVQVEMRSAVPPEPPETLKERTRALIADRRRRQPRGATAGSTFVAPAESGHPAGYWIDRAGLKGHVLGGARVSPKHANWIENTGTATASDIAALMDLMQTEVSRLFGVQLMAEVRRLP